MARSIASPILSAADIVPTFVFVTRYLSFSTSAPPDVAVMQVTTNRVCCERRGA
jgi:hypothetical protein